ncbi:acyl transferase domain-containing protein [Paenibacillus harenae]|nr:SDR family NAD(P)-dependent oxidoreductase [Paenibacillus harenae]MDQ0059016.1 acyl transferase domain-containing protein [Paenibacillus harenae]
MKELKKMTFSTMMRYEDLIVRDHRVHQTRIMPGVTFIDMIYRLLLSKGFSAEEAELRSILFKEPVATTEQYDKKIRITFQPVGSHYLVTAQSQKMRSDQALEASWADNLQCELHLGKKVPVKTIDADALVAGAVRLEDMEHTYSYMRKTSIEHYEFMKMLGRVHVSDDYRLGEAHLSGLAQQYADSFFMHPAFLDGATCVADAAMLAKAAGGAEIKPFIPMFIESFRAWSGLGEKVYVYIPAGSMKITASGDMLYSDIELYNMEGVQVASFVRLGFKQVRSQSLIHHLEKVDGSGNDQASAAMQPPTVALTNKPAQKTKAAIESKLRSMVARLLDLPADKVNVETGFYDLGLDSRQLLALVEELETLTGSKLYPTLLFEYTSVAKLSDYLFAENKGTFRYEEADAQETAERPSGSLLHTIRNDLSRMVALLLGRPIEEVSAEDGFYDQGLDSRQLLKLVQELETKLGSKLYPTLLFEYTSIDKLADYIAEEHGQAYSSAVGADPILPQEQELTAASVTKQSGQTLLENSFFYRPQWVEKPLAEHSISQIGQSVLIIASKDSKRLAAELTSMLSGKDIYELDLGTETKQLTDRLWEIRTGSAEALDLVLNEWPTMDSVFFLGGMHHRPSKLNSLAELEHSQEQGAITLFRLVKAFVKRKWMSKLRRLYVIANNVHEVAASEQTIPYGGSAFGLAKTIAVEYPQVQLHALDLAREEEPLEQAAAILSEPSHPQARETAIRGGRRYVLDVRPVQLPSVEPTLLRPNGVYLIVGGAGGIGLELAYHLAVKAKASLILTGRSDLNELQRSKIADIEALGSRVLYIRADVTELSDMQQAVKQAKAHFGALHGVVHSAMALNDKVLAAMDETVFRAGLAPKVTGTAVLYEALKDEPLDFLMFFSSVLSLVGNVGQSNYTAGCAFKDAYAHAIRQRVSYPVKIFNWGYWGTVGAGKSDDIRKQLSSIGAEAIDSSAGMVAIDRMLGLNLTQIIPLKADDKLLTALGVNLNQPAVPFTEIHRPHHSASTIVDVTIASKASAAATLEQTENRNPELDIAIIGISGRYPGANSMEEFWDNLKHGRDSVTEIPSDRWNVEQYFNPDKNQAGGMYSKWGGFMEDVDKFDPLFFNISPREAELMDPQERLFLETVWHAIEDAGYNKSGLGRKVGVYVGAMWGQYQLLAAEANGSPVMPSSIYASIANRVSYFFHYSGPSMAVDTMCSSSLTAIHLACESLRRGEINAAVAGGVNVTIHPNKYMFLSQNNFVSSDGRCRSFGEGGDGYVPGEGVGAVILKRADKAAADGDRIYAVIKGSAINHGGYASGYYVPNPNAQAEVITEAIEGCGINPRTISYVEAHGTGTSLGDPIEIAGLNKAFKGFTKDKQFCAIGSVKSNIGHLESAAGISGLSKLLLQMQHKQLVPSLHSETLNSGIDFTSSPFYVQQQLGEWRRPVLEENGRSVAYPRRASISAFGAGGSNAHLIIEEYEMPAAITNGGPQLLVISARSEERLKEIAGRLAARLAEGGIQLDEAAYSLQRREEMDERLAFAASDMEDAIEKLNRYANGSSANGFACNNVRVNQEIASAEGVAALAAARNLEGLAQLWVKGCRVDWKSLYPAGIPAIVSLPAYPFLRKRYWINSYRSQEKKPTTTATAAPSIPAIKDPGPSFGQKVMDAYRPDDDGTSDDVKLEIIDGSIALLTMSDRENRNMFSDKLVGGLMAQFHKLRHNESIKAIVLTGYDNIFAFGGTQEQLTMISERTFSFTDVPFMFRGLLECEIPVITAIQGHASGGGLLFGLYGDIVVMAEEGVYNAVFMKYGFTPGMGATYILQDKLGKNLATEMMFTARSFRGEELRDRGSSVLIRPGKEVVQEAVSIARMLIDKPLHSLKTLKAELAGRTLRALPEVIAAEEQMHEETFGHPDVKKRIEYYYLTSDARTNAAAAAETAFDESFMRKLLADLEAGSISPNQAARLSKINKP